MVNKLFSSQVMYAVLAALFSSLEMPLSTASLIRLSGKGQANVQRELDKLVAWGMVLKEKKHNQNFYSFNKEYQAFSSLKALFDQQLENKKRYFLFNEEGGTCVLSVDFFLEAYTSDYGIKAGVISQVADVIAVYEDDYGRFYFEEDIINEEAERAFKKLLKDASFVFGDLSKKSLKAGHEAMEIFKDLYANGFKIDKKQAVELVNRFLDIITIQIGLNTIAIFDLKDQIYSNYLKKYLEKKLKGSGLAVSQVMEQLLAPDDLTYTQKLRRELIRLALSSPRGRNLETELARIHSLWGWLNYGYVGPGLNLDYFRQSYQELLAQPRAQLARELKEIDNNYVLARRSKQAIYRRFSIDVKHQKFIDALSVLSYLKIYRKDTAFLIFHCLYRCLAKIMPQEKGSDLRYLTIAELKGLLNGEFKPNWKDIRHRRDCARIYSQKRFLYGREAKDYLEAVVVKDESATSAQKLKLLEGTAACLGRTGDWVHGEVKIINSPADMAKMKPGDVLVSIATTPDILPAMKQAAAIVTDHGGITCHAAIVSRELNIPCLIATKYATKVFKDGDKVIVCPRHNYIKFQ